MVFSALSFVLGLMLVAGGAAVLRGRPLDPGLAARLPRAQFAGTVLGVVCLLWSAYHGCLMLEGGLATYRKLLWALVPVAAVLCYHFLDYLLARALGGLLVLVAAALLHGGFAEGVAWRHLHSAACYLTGLWGMALIAVPWRFRDLLLGLSRAVPWRRPAGCVVLAVGLVLAVLPFLPRTV
jgi:hypothetical protein